VKLAASRNGAHPFFFSRGSLTVCFVAKAGKEYTTRPSSDDGETWYPMVVDNALAYPINFLLVEGPQVDGRRRLAAEAAAKPPAERPQRLASDPVVR
jgi:hypothetical protein